MIDKNKKDIHPALFMLIVVIMAFSALAVLNWGGQL